MGRYPDSGPFPWERIPGWGARGSHLQPPWGRVPPEKPVRPVNVRPSVTSATRRSDCHGGGQVDMVGAHEDRPVRVDLGHQVHRQVSPVSPTRDLGAPASARRLSTSSSTASPEAGRQDPVGLARQEVGRMAGSTCVRESRNCDRLAAETSS